MRGNTPMLGRRFISQYIFVGYAAFEAALTRGRPRLTPVGYSPRTGSAGQKLPRMPRTSATPTGASIVTVTEGVLITGVYGTGKTSVCEEIAELLESAAVAYGAIDLDWLAWFGTPGLDDAVAQRVKLANVAAVVNNYIEAGVERFVLAGAVRS